MTKLNEHGAIATWSYQRPAPRTDYRKIWRGEAPMITEWAYCRKSRCGTYWETSTAVTGFASEKDAILAARKEAKKN